MHWNLRLSDAVPFILRFNWHAHAKFEVPSICPFLSYSILLVIRYTVTLNTGCDRDMVKLYRILARLNNPRQSYSDFDIWPNDLEHVLGLRVLLSALG